MKDIINNLEKEFLEIFGKENERKYFSPGRVNLIGEHTDYNGGNVFPCALDFGTYALVRKNTEKKMRVISLNFRQKGIIEFPLHSLVYDEKDNWANYPKGVLSVLTKEGYRVEEGLDILFWGNIPNGAGLSSSASIEVLVGLILNDYFEFGIDMIDLVKYSQKAENEFVGVNCGIMDQFAIGMGKRNHAILLDCNSLVYKYAPLKLEDAVIVIGNTNKRRGLADSKYNERRAQCEEALGNLQEKLEINSLGELSIEEFEQNKKYIKNEINIKRAKHAVYENRRTIEGVEALENNNIDKFGKLMNESHISLRDDYEVTGFELDTMVSIAWEQEGVIGSRMTGAGFGGCTVSLVKKESVDKFIENVSREYKEKTGLDPDFYLGNIGEGTRRL